MGLEVFSRQTKMHELIGGSLNKYFGIGSRANNLIFTMSNKLNSSRILTYFSVLGLITLITPWPLTGNTGEDGDLDISGVWSNALLTPEDERWRIEDIACARTGCSLAGFTFLQSLLNDKKNQNRTVKTLFYEMRDYEKKQNEDLLTPLAQKKQAEYDPAQGKGGTRGIGSIKGQNRTIHRPRSPKLCLSGWSCKSKPH